jgi:RNA-binding protein
MAQIHDLRKKVHNLHPIVTVAGKGLTENVLAEIDRALFDHELIKVKLNIMDRDERKQLAEQICDHSQATLVQSIGKIIAIYRKKPQQTD